jgi:type IV pilus assembly protein PilE
MKGKLQRGFTLIEFMMVMVVIGILLGIALPAYSEYLMKTRRADGTSYLMVLAGEQEKWFFANNTFTSTLTDIGNATSPDGFYTITLSNSVAGVTCNGGGGPFNCFELTATAAGRQAGDTDCATITLDHRGLRAAQMADASDSSALCW